LENSIVDDRYYVERCLGRGSYAEIFLAYDQNASGEPVIIKALNTSLQGTPDTELDRTLVENFQNEAIALDKVRHPNIIRRLGHGTAADLAGVPFHYLVLEYMPGGDLLSFCRRHPLSLETAVDYFKQVADALAYAHGKLVIHRDVKPNNLLLSEDHRTVKIADFGVAKMTPGEADEITRVGTNVYAPPEHHPDSPSEEMTEKLTPSADIYSLAKTIYTAMTGRAPRQFARVPITEIPAELLSEAWGDELLRVLRKATATRVADRYKSVQEFWDDFARLPLANEADEEATIVRSRLGSAGAIERAGAQPDFQALASGPIDAAHAQKARIVVEIPAGRGQGAGVRGQGVDTVNGVEAERILDNQRLTPDPRILNPAPQTAVKRKDKSFFDKLRDRVGSDWLRRAFIVFLLFALVGLALSTYYHFSGKRVELPQIFGGSQYKTGAVVDYTDLYLRNAPGGEILTTLPRTTRLKVFETRNGWSRVEVTGPMPGGAPDSGWVNSKYIELD
jgi:hypothetical protein